MSLTNLLRCIVYLRGLVHFFEWVKNFMYEFLRIAPQRWQVKYGPVCFPGAIIDVGVLSMFDAACLKNVCPVECMGSKCVIF